MYFKKSSERSIVIFENQFCHIKFCNLLPYRLTLPKFLKLYKVSSFFKSLYKSLFFQFGSANSTRESLKDLKFIETFETVGQFKDCSVMIHCITPKVNLPNYLLKSFGYGMSVYVFLLIFSRSQGTVTKIGKQFRGLIRSCKVFSQTRVIFHRRRY